MSSMEDDLIESGHPLLALLNHISNAPNSLLKSWATALSPSGKEAAALQAAVRRFILSTPSDSKVRMQACNCGTCFVIIGNGEAPSPSSIVVDALSAVRAGINSLI